MAKLTTKKRNALPSSTFALPGRKYLLDTANRARNALARGAQNATPEELATIRAKVRRRYPGIAVGGKRKGKRASSIVG